MRRSLSRCGYSNIPWEQFVEACDFAVSASGEYPSELGLEIHDVELGGFDQGIGDGRSLSAALGADKEVVLQTQSHAAD